jgi:hypothetical protein
MLYGPLFSLPRLYGHCRIVIADCFAPRETREARDALRVIREDTARRLASEQAAANQAATKPV